MSIAANGALVITECHKGFKAYLKNKVPDVLAVRSLSAFSCDKSE